MYSEVDFSGKSRKCFLNRQENFLFLREVSMLRLDRERFFKLGRDFIHDLDTELIGLTKQ